MGFAAVADTSDWVDNWFLSMNKYRTMQPTDIKHAWLSKEAVSQLDIPMPVKKHVNSEKDKELKQLLQDIMPDQDPYGGTNARMDQQLTEMQQQFTEIQQSLTSLSSMISSFTGGGPSPAIQSVQDRFRQMQELCGSVGSKLTNEKKLDIKRLVDAGASLRGIDALHLTAAAYKDEDLFDLLIDEYGLSVEEFDQIGRKPIHVAACTSNADGVRILIEKGADKDAKNKEGQTALQEMNQVERSMGDFGRAMFGGAGPMMGGPDFVRIRRLLN